MSSDLRFAYFQVFPSEVVGIIDVLGQKDLVRNVIAGVWGIDAAILVITANDGWMLQIEKHLKIMGLFLIKRGTTTKVNLISHPE